MINEPPFGIRCGGALRNLGEREARDHHGVDEVLARRVGVASGQLLGIGIRERVDNEVEAAPLFFDTSENIIDAGEIEDIALLDDLRTQRLRQRRSAAAESAALICEGEFGALSGERAGNAPGDRSVVGDAHHKTALARHQRTWLCDIEVGHRKPRFVTKCTPANVKPASSALIYSHRPRPSAVSQS